MSEGRVTVPTRAVEDEVTIDAPVEVVWKALTDADELVRWFPLEARVEPGVGGSLWLSWKNEFQGESKILVWEPGSHLRTTWGWHDDPSVVQVTDYHLESRGGRTVLRVVTSGFPEDPTWDAWFEGTVRGWKFELGSLRHYLQRHRGERREVVYLRRRVGPPQEAAFERLLGAEGVGVTPAPDELEAGGPYAITGPGGRRLSGRLLDATPPIQVAGTVAELDDALLRLSIEPFGMSEERDVTLWLSVWGERAARASDLKAGWEQLLAAAFPEGQSV